MVKDIFLHSGGQRKHLGTLHIQIAQDIFHLLKGPDPSYLVLTFSNILLLIYEIWPTT